MNILQILSQFLLISAWSFKVNAKAKRPNIIFIFADDLGFNDVSFHGSSQIPTPNIDALAYSGIILDRYYVTPLCTPSRASLMTGKYPIHTGTQHDVIQAIEPRGLSLNETLMPQYLNKLGYKSHIVGKWHLGHWKREYTPLYRGFLSHVGYWTGHQDYNDHTSFERPGWGYDMRRGMEVARDLHGQYTTDVITEESVKIIKEHDKEDPLFLYIPHLACHSSNQYDPLPAPDEVVAEMNHIDDYMRRRYAAVLTKLDRSVGEVMHALNEENMLENSIIIFSTDNGGAPEGFNINHGSNWPLRGAKYNLWEGGVRGVGLIWSPLLKEQQRVSHQLMHLVDWLPTLYCAAGGDVATLPNNLDGMNLWEVLSSNKVSPRKEVLLNIDDHFHPKPIFAIISDNYKLMTGTWFEGDWDGWYGPKGDRDPLSYNVAHVRNSKSGRVLDKMGALPNPPKIENLRQRSTLNCSFSEDDYDVDRRSCHPLEEDCLFDLSKDPCERENIASKFPDVVKKLLERIEFYRGSSIPASNQPYDHRGDPKFWDYTWTNFGDYNYFDADNAFQYNYFDSDAYDDVESNFLMK